MTTSIVTYSGGFHDSPDLRLRVRIIERGGYTIGQLSPSQRQRLERHFCGIDGCTCGAACRAEIDHPGIDGVE